MNYETILNSESKQKKKMGTMTDENKPSEYDPNLRKLDDTHLFYTKLMLNQKYLDVIRQSDLVTNFNPNQIKAYLNVYRSNLIELTKDNKFKYEIVNSSNEILDRIKRLNDYINQKRMFDKTQFKLDPKIYPKRSQIDLPRLKNLLDTTGMEGTSLRKLANEYKVSVGTMHIVVKKILGYRYKQVYPLNVKVVNQGNMNSTLLFMMKHSLLIEDKHKFIYIDESSFNNHKRSKKRWVMKRKINFCYDYGKLKSKSLILAMTNKMVLQTRYNLKTNTAYHFNRFLKDLALTVEADPFLKSLYEDKKLVLILDNARIHKTEEVKETLIGSSFKVLFLPPYTPQFNPIELAFNCIKRRFYDLTFVNR